jgi:hypothetical protein
MTAEADVARVVVVGKAALNSDRSSRFSKKSRRPSRVAGRAGRPRLAAGWVDLRNMNMRMPPPATIARVRSCRYEKKKEMAATD